MSSWPDGSAGPDPARPRSRRAGRWGGVAVVVAVTLVALALRWPNLTLVPAFTDETDEIEFAMQVARGGFWPLTHDNTYMGVVYPYLLAALFRLLGPSALVARGMMAVAGALTAGAAAWLALAMCAAGRGGLDVSTAAVGLPVGSTNPSPNAAPSPRLAALVAGLFAATSLPLVLLNSHVAWSNGLTPLFTTAALGLTWAAVLRGRGWWLLGGAFLWGLALQTHPSALGPLVGVALWALLQPTGRGWLRTRWAWLAAGALLLGYANMIAFNLLQAGQSLAEVADPRRSFVPVAGLADYVGRLGAVALQLARMAAGAYLPFNRQNAPLVVTPAVAVYGALAVAALAWAARRRWAAVLPWAVVATFLALPLLTDGFVSLYATRYLAPALVLVYAAAGLAAAQLVARWTRPGPRLAVAVTAAALIGWPVAATAQFTAQTHALGLTNAPYLAVAQDARAAADAGALVLMDRDSDDIKLGGGGGPERALRLLMTLDGTPYQMVRADKLRYFLEQGDVPLFLILGERHEAEFVARHGLRPTGRDAVSYRVYRNPN